MRKLRQRKPNQIVQVHIVKRWLGQAAQSQEEGALKGHGAQGHALPSPQGETGFAPRV